MCLASGLRYGRGCHTRWCFRTEHEYVATPSESLDCSWAIKSIQEARKLLFDDSLIYISDWWFCLSMIQILFVVCWMCLCAGEHSISWAVNWLRAIAWLLKVVMRSGNKWLRLSQRRLRVHWCIPLRKLSLFIGLLREFVASLSGLETMVFPELLRRSGSGKVAEIAFLSLIYQWIILHCLKWETLITKRLIRLFRLFLREA